jgi:hypothetical protein
MMATQEFVVPRSIPITLAILTLHFVISALQQRLLVGSRKCEAQHWVR